MMLAHRFICDVNDTRTLIGPCFLVTSPWCQIRNPCRVQPFPIAHMVISLSLHIHSFLRLSFRALWLAIHSAPLEQCWPTSFWLHIRWIDICDYRLLGMGEMKLGGGFEGYNHTITLGPMSSVTVAAVVQRLRCEIRVIKGLAWNCENRACLLALSRAYQLIPYCDPATQVTCEILITTSRPYMPLAYTNKISFRYRLHCLPMDAKLVR